MTEAITAAGEGGGGAEPVLVGDRLGKTYGQRPLRPGGGGTVGLTGVSVAIRPGELVCIVGRSGQGKSTLLRILAMDEAPTEGRLLVLGRDVAALTRSQADDLRSQAIHYIPQRHLGLLPRTALETVAYWLVRLDALSPLEAEARAAAALAAVALPPHKFGQRVDRGFSGGEGARVALATAFARGRPICLADEVFAGLDLESALPLVGLFRELVRRGTAVVIIVHQPELWPYFDRVVTIDHHRLAGDARNADPLLPRQPPVAFAPELAPPLVSVACPTCGHPNASSELYCTACLGPLHGTRPCPCGRHRLPLNAAFCTGWRCARPLASGM